MQLKQDLMKFDHIHELYREGGHLQLTAYTNPLHVYE